MTIERFTEIYALLSLQLSAPNNDGAAVRAYYRVLEHCEPALLQLAAEQLAATSTWFPKSSEWLDMAKAIKRMRLVSQQEMLRNLHRRGLELCGDCGDTGWIRNGADSVAKCPCQALRHAEILGVKPLPALTA